MLIAEKVVSWKETPAKKTQPLFSPHTFQREGEPCSVHDPHLSCLLFSGEIAILGTDYTNELLGFLTQAQNWPVAKWQIVRVLEIKLEFLVMKYTVRVCFNIFIGTW